MTITCIKPRGTASILTNASSGVHPNPCSEIYLRRDTEKWFAAKAAKEIAHDIDWGILSCILLGSGWTEVKLQTTTPSGYVHEIMEWLGKNRTGHVRSRGNHYMFENAKDATLFILKWS